LINQGIDPNEPKQLGVTAYVFFANYLFNISYFFIHVRKIKTDAEYLIWINERENQITHKVIFIASMLTSFKLARVLYS
jgi:hypothetical protein